jgi:hypothetical protein
MLNAHLAHAMPALKQQELNSGLISNVDTGTTSCTYMMKVWYHGQIITNNVVYIPWLASRAQAKLCNLQQDFEHLKQKLLLAFNSTIPLSTRLKTSFT